MPVPTPDAIRQRYQQMREAGWPRREAASAAGVSYRTAQRLDDNAGLTLCPTCGRTD